MKLKIVALQLQALELAQARESLSQALALISRAAQLHQPDLIVTPECTYPAYVLGSFKEFKANYPGDALPAFAEKAREYKLHLCVGVATPAETSDVPLIYNEAVLIGPDGEIIGRTAKSILWHFDNKWFCAGSSYPVFETAIGRIGMLVCADGRAPEIARSLALAGAQIILDPTCWVAYGTDAANLAQPQADYMLPTRAYENGVWCVAADKVGLERGTVLYAGRSCVIAPNGRKVAEASGDREAIVFAEIELAPRALAAVPRRPELYGKLTAPTETLPIHSLLQEAIVPQRAQLRVAVAQFRPFETTQAMGETIRPLVAQFAREGVELAVMPDVSPALADEAAYRGDLVFPFYRSLSKLSGVALLATAVESEGGRRYKTARLFSKGEEVGQWRQSHFSPQDEGEWTAAPEIGPVVKLPGESGARIGVMLGADGYAPEVARSLMLAGADLILWPTRAVLPGAESGFGLPQLARSRAGENRVYVLCATPFEAFGGGLDEESRERGCALIVDPNGTIIAPALPYQPMGVSAQILVAASRTKLSVPGTDVVYNRQPESYAILLEDAAS